MRWGALAFASAVGLLGAAPTAAAQDGEPAPAAQASEAEGSEAEDSEAEDSEAEDSDAEPVRSPAPRRAEQLDPRSFLTLRPWRSLRRIALRVASALSLRLEVEVQVGEPPPPQLVEAVPTAHVGLVRDGAEVLVVLAGPAGLVYQARVDLPASRDAAVRTVALTIEALRDAAIEGPPPPEGEVGEGAPPGTAARPHERVGFTYLEPEGGIFGVRRRHEPTARPTVYLRALLGFSTARETVLLGPGIGLGLCISEGCAVLEGDLPILPDERTSPLDGAVIRYRPVNLSLRVLVRPLRVDDLVFGASLGILTRFGQAWIDETGASQTVTNFGLRGTLEAAWIFAAPFEWVVEGGVDFAANPAAFVRGGETILLEDVVTVWGVTSVRLRPE